MKIKYFFICLSLLVILSCSEKKRYLSNEFAMENNVSLKLLENFPGDSLLQPSMICSFQNYIILLEEKLNMLLCYYDMATGRFKRFQKKGRGPGELLNVQQITCTSDRDGFCAWELYKDRAYVYSAKDNFSSISEILPISGDFVTFKFTPDYVIGVQENKPEHFMIQFSADSLYEFGEDIRIGKFGTEVASSFVIGDCLFHNDLKRFAFFSAFGDVFELYDCRNTPEITKNYRGCLPVLDKNFKVPSMTAETKLGVLSSTATDKYILALYSDHLMKEFSLANDKMWWVNKVLVYDWEGNPVKILILDKPVKALSYNHEKGLVYCIGLTESGNNIFYFDPKNI